VSSARIPRSSCTRRGTRQTKERRRKNTAIVVFVCRLTKMVHYVATTTNVTAPQLATLFMREVVRLHGVPQAILSDRDPRFTAHFWRAFWTQLGTTLTMSTAYHPQTDGQTERANRTLEEMLRSRINFAQTDWDEHLSIAELAVNNAQQASTGFSPFYLNYGKEVELPLDRAIAELRPTNNPEAAARIRRLHADLARAHENLERAQQRQAHYANQHRRDVTFKVGDQVLLSTEHLKMLGSERRTPKFTFRYLGPFKVKRVVNANSYELDLPPTMQIHPTLNIDRLKPYRDGRLAFPDRPLPENRPPPEATLENGAAVYKVESILAKMGAGARAKYLVKWLGYPTWESTWEPAASLRNAADAVAEYENQLADRNLNAMKILPRRTTHFKLNTIKAPESKSGPWRIHTLSAHEPSHPRRTIDTLTSHHVTATRTRWPTFDTPKSEAMGGGYDYAGNGKAAAPGAAVASSSERSLEKGRPVTPNEEPNDLKRIRSAGALHPLATPARHLSNLARLRLAPRRRLWSDVLRQEVASGGRRLLHSASAEGPQFLPEARSGRVSFPPRH
jgi:hypothetical protein